MSIPWLNRLVTLALVFLTGALASFGAAKTPDGRALYRKECASCHGKTGDGVKDKYADGLHGDWALEKLTRRPRA